MTKFFFKFKKPYFWPVSQFWRQKKLFQSSLSVTQNCIRVSSAMPKFRQIAGGKDGQILLYRTLLATARDPTSTTAVDWHLKVKDIEYDVSLTKHYCLTVSMQKISSVHKLIFKIQQILGPNELNSHAQF